jgi:hypothetical protein
MPPQDDHPIEGVVDKWCSPVIRDFGLGEDPMVAAERFH